MHIQSNEPEFGVEPIHIEPIHIEPILHGEPIPELDTTTPFPGSDEDTYDPELEEEINLVNRLRNAGFHRSAEMELKRMPKPEGRQPYSRPRPGQRKVRR